VDVLGRYLSLLIWPHPLCADYSYAAIPFSPGLLSARTALTVAALAAAALGAWWSRRDFPSLGLALALFVVTLAPVCNLIVPIGVLMAERLLYLPSISICIVAGECYSRLRRSTRPRLADLLAATVALALLGLTLARNTDWDTPLQLWRDTVQKAPRSGLAHANLALCCRVIGDHACALDELGRAVALDPTRVDFQETLRALEAEPAR
jgi:hypothetical protein